MNQLEELSRKNRENYRRYLDRMTESMKYSTKGLIPLLAKNSKNILDVGCGSGVMLRALENENPKARLTGLDLNIDSLRKLRKNNCNWKLYHMDFMDLNNVKFDTIIFSSILHEISSYNSDINKRFTGKPIKDALIKSNQLLEPNGILIVRDGLLSSVKKRDNKLIVTFSNINDDIWLYRFQKDFKGFANLDIDTNIIKLENNKYLVSEGFLKEVERLCRAHDIILMIDEVQTGNGRTGELYAYMHYGVQPDVVSTA